jgi:hypothetical protein
MKKIFFLLAFVLGGSVTFIAIKFLSKNVLVLSRTSSSAEMKSADLFVEQAEEYLSNFKSTHTLNSSISFTVDSADIAKLLNDPRAGGGLRAYFGVKDKSKPNNITLMFVAVDKNHENIFHVREGKEYVVDYTNPCPTDCPPRANTGELDRRTIKK